MNRAIVIRTAGDAKLAGAIADGMSKSMMPMSDYAKLAVKEDRDRRHWAALIEQAQRDYGDNPAHGRLVNAVLGLYGLCVLAAAKLKQMNRG